MKVNNISKIALSTLSIFTLFVIFNVQMTDAATIGKISGTVTAEASKQPLANVKISIVDTSTSTTTNESGYYVMTNIDPGGYDVRAELPGYLPKTIASTTVFAGLTTTINFTLEATEIVELEGVTVTATKPLIKKDVTQTTRIIEADEIASMPRDTVNGILQTHRVI